MNTRPSLVALLILCSVMLVACNTTNAPKSSQVSAVQADPASRVANDLTLNIFNAPPRPLKLPLPVAAPAGGWTWPPTSATLIAGKRDAILVDTVATLDDANKLADWIAASGKNLTTIYITHGHIDHYLGTATLLERFPRARVVATEATVRLIKEELASGVQRATYSPFFVDKIGSTIVVPEVLTGNRLLLEGHEILAVTAGQSDVSDSSYVYVPELAAVIVGDIAYNGVHPTLVTSTHQARLDWIKTLTVIQALKPRIVIAAHRNPAAPDDAKVLADTITYLQDADRLLAKNLTAQQFIEQMLAAHPDRLNITTLIFSTAMQGLRQK